MVLSVGMSSMTAFPAWYYDEMKLVGVDFEDPAQVEAYDRNQTVSTTEAEQALITQLGIAAGHTVIDLGAGTGTFAIQAALAGAKVYAVDVSHSMLAYAQQKAQRMGAKNIEFHQAGFLSYSHQGEKADFLVTKNAFHFLPDFWKIVAFLRMAQMLKAGGIFYLRDVVFSFAPDEYQTKINAWIERVAKPEGSGWTARDFEMHIKEEHSTFGWIIEEMLTLAGFTILEADYFAPEYAQYVCQKS